MRTPANIAGHPIHPMLVTLPIGMWVLSLACDLIGLRAAAPETWATVALYAMVGGIIGALAAAVAGLVDLLSLGDTPVRKTALTHMGLNLVIVALYAINAWMRVRGTISANAAVGLSVISILALLVSGWLGGKMVYLAGVGVSTDEAMATDRSAGWGTSAAPRTPTAAGYAARRGDHAMATDTATRGRDERSTSVRSGDLPRE